MQQYEFRYEQAENEPPQYQQQEVRGGMLGMIGGRMRLRMGGPPLRCTGAISSLRALGSIDRYRSKEKTMWQAQQLASQAVAAQMGVPVRAVAQPLVRTTVPLITRRAIHCIYSITTRSIRSECLKALYPARY